VQGTAVSINNQALVPGSIFGLSCSRPNWLKERTNTGGAIPSSSTVWAAVSLNTIVVWPTHTVDQTVTIDGIRQTPQLADDADFLDLDDTLQNVLVGHALHLATLKAPAALLQETVPYKEAFLRAAVERNAVLRAANWYRRLTRQHRQQGQQPTHVAAPDPQGPSGL
jgi:predicted nucleic acid-binding protein